MSLKRMKRRLIEHFVRQNEGSVGTFAGLLDNSGSQKRVIKKDDFARVLREYVENSYSEISSLLELVASFKSSCEHFFS